MALLPDMSEIVDIRSILVVRLKALGDIVLSLPVISALRESFPQATISYLCWSRYAGALAGDTGLDEVIEFKRSFWDQASLIAGLRRKRIDFVLDLLSSPRSAIITRMTGAGLRIGMDVGRHNWCYHYVLPRVITREGGRVRFYTLETNRELMRMLNLRGAPGGYPDGGVRTFPENGRNRCVGERRIGLDIGFPAAELEKDWIDAYLGTLGIDPSRLVGVVPGAKYHSKSWPAVNFIELAGMLIEEQALTPIIMWGPGEERVSDMIVREVPGAIKAPATGIEKLGALIGRMKLLVTLDSGPKHLAVIQGVPTVTLFGPTDPRVWDPMNAKHRVLYRGLECSPCRDRDCKDNRCLADITPREVADTVADLLASIPIGDAWEKEEE